MRRRVDPRGFVLRRGLRCLDRITRAILSGERGPKRDAVLLNAGAALYIGGKAETMKDGVALAAELIDSGKALKTLERLIEVSNRPEAEV